MQILNKIINKIDWYYNLKFKKDINYINFDRWIKDGGPHTLRFAYPLNSNSVVIDAGGYRGDWSARISELYDPYIYIFEPIHDYYEMIVDKFKSNNKVKVFNSGLSGENKKILFKIQGESSSMILNDGHNSVEVDLLDIYEMVRQNNITHIDLIKINIEGGEFELLERMISTGMVVACNDIQVQFHHWAPNAILLRENILNSLKLTHYSTYQYPFVWENYRKIEQDQGASVA